jgi:hypothetical protein
MVVSPLQKSCCEKTPQLAKFIVGVTAFILAEI